MSHLCLSWRMFFFLKSESIGALFSGFDVCCLAVAARVQGFAPPCDRELMYMLTGTVFIRDNSLQYCKFHTAGSVSKIRQTKSPSQLRQEGATARSVLPVLLIGLMLLQNCFQSIRSVTEERRQTHVLRVVTVP